MLTPKRVMNSPPEDFPHKGLSREPGCIKAQPDRLKVSSDFQPEAGAIRLSLRKTKITQWFGKKRKVLLRASDYAYKDPTISNKIGTQSRLEL